MKPATSRGALARMDRSFPLTVKAELAEVEQRLGGRGVLVGLLTLAPLTGDLRHLLGLLGDPQHQTTPLADLCALGDVLPGDLLRHLGAAALLRGKVEASQKIGAGIAAVAEDVMRRAAPYEDTCTECRGTGSITPDPTPKVPNPQPAPCDTCLATGRLRYAPDLERQKLAIEMAQLLPKSGGINIAMQQNNSGGSGDGSASRTLERLTALTDQLLYGAGPAHAGADPGEAPPIDGEIADASDA